MSEVTEKARAAKATTVRMGTAATAMKNDALLRMARRLIECEEKLLTANRTDLEHGRANGIAVSLLDRLALNPARIRAMAQGLEQLVELPDPVGEQLAEYRRPNGLVIRQHRVPIGLIGIIYEARPNVTVDAAGLCLKTGNAVILRGGSAAQHSNRAIVDCLHEALADSELPADALQLIEQADRSSVDEMLRLNGLLDCVIPRGGAALIQHVVKNATVPVIETGAGVCHTYLEADADQAMAFEIALNAKVQRPSVCNAMETLLVHRAFAERHLPELAERFRERGVELRGCALSRDLVPWVVPAAEEDWATEYNDMILSVKIVDSLDAALAHIARYGTSHSECIVTEDRAKAARFLDEVDAAAVYHNASTRFTDGYEFGFGAEIGISTQKLHARGPMGLPALTSSKYVIYGNGQIRA